MSEKKRKRPLAVRWKAAPEEHDYPAALSYLSLLMPSARAQEIIYALRAVEPCAYKAKDLLRASQLALLPRSNYHVRHNIAKVRAGEELVPILLVRGDFLENAPLIIADGYHRLCASYWLDEDLDIPCHIADWPPYPTLPEQQQKQRIGRKHGAKSAEEMAA